jgi:tRNA(Ile)-lysidine synthase
VKDVLSAVRDEIDIPQGGHIVCGVSGGPDSLCLLHVLFTLKDELGFSMSAVHVNHMLRSYESDADQWFVEKLCEEWGVPATSRKVDVKSEAAKNGETMEEAGRKARYTVFDEAATAQMKKRGVDIGMINIAVAHNENDQAETVLMRIIRGTGTDGLAGMEASRSSKAGFRIIRPLLAVERADIEEYCIQHGLFPRVDHTNAEKGPMRNDLRLELIPQIRSQYNPAFPDALLRLGRIAAEDKAYFDRIVGEILRSSCTLSKDEDEVHSAELPLNVLAEAEPAVRHRVILAVFARIGLIQDCSDAHIVLADRILQGGDTGRGVDFPSGYRLEISYEKVRFLAPGAEKGADFIGSFAVSVADLRTRLKNSEVFLDSPLPVKTELLSGDDPLADAKGDQLFLDYDALAAENMLLILRTRQQGDRISPVGMTGSKKLQDIFVDDKVSREERDKTVLLATENEVLWILGGRRTRLYPVTEETKNILRLTPMK